MHKGQYEIKIIIIGKKIKGQDANYVMNSFRGNKKEQT